MKTPPLRHLITVACMAFLMALLPILVAIALAQGGPPSQADAEALLAQLEETTGGSVRIAFHEETGKVRFLGTEPDRPMTRPAAAGAPAEELARAFLEIYGPLFGLKDPARELKVTAARTLSDGRAFVRFQQTYEGVPVISGELIVQLGRDGAVISANGEIVPAIDLDVTPAIDAARARQTAVAAIARAYALSPDRLSASEPELWIHNPALLQGPGPRKSTLVWRLEVRASELLPIRELVLVDANLGVVTLHFNQIDGAKDRVVYDNANDPAFGLPGNGPVRAEGDPASGIADADLAYDYTGDTYDFYASEHGRDSLDDAGMRLISTTRYCPDSTNCPYENAFWNGEQMVYGEGFTADDVVAHELTHGVTDYSSHLFYWYQSGAINESLSDVWGELVDQSNGAGSDGAGVRWLIGEDLPGGAIRNMADPTDFGEPDRITSGYYYCGELDNGGVHTNSGVNNKAAFLMIDGGSFNGRTVTALGRSMVADLYYEAQTNLLTSGSNYADLYDALVQASINLGFGSTQRAAVKNALDAVEMSQRPCGDAAEAPVCEAGFVPVDRFFDDFENPPASDGSGLLAFPSPAPTVTPPPTGASGPALPAGVVPSPAPTVTPVPTAPPLPTAAPTTPPVSTRWVSRALVGTNGWYYPQNSHPFPGFDATNASSGIYNLWGYDQGTRSDSYIAMTSSVVVPSGARMHFKHAWAFEDYGTTAYDGGVVEYSTDEGSTWHDAAALFTHNGYNGTISTAFGNPLGGRQAFTAESHGYTASRLDLSGLAGRSIRFRFRIGTDSSLDQYGWFIDDVRIYTCGTSGQITVTPTSLTVREGAAPKSFRVKLGSQPTADVTIGLSTSNGECSVSPASLKLTRSNWATGVTASVAAVNDSRADGNKTCVVRTGAASSGDARYDGVNPADITVTVEDDDTAGAKVYLPLTVR